MTGYQSNYTFVAPMWRGGGLVLKHPPEVLKNIFCIPPVATQQRRYCAAAVCLDSDVVFYLI